MSNSSVFVYLAYGGRQFRQQAIVSISSLLNTGPLPGTVFAFTDRPRDFEAMPIETVHLSDEQIRKWKGPYGFTHRLKIELILDVQKKTGKPVLYVDSDTFWTRNPAETLAHLQNGFPVMYKRERPVSKTFFPEFLAITQKKELLRASGIPTTAPEEIWDYNAGVIGIPGNIHPDILVETLAFCDLLSREVPFWMEWVEEYAFSYVFQSHGLEIKTCEEDLHHYWCDSFEFGRQIGDFSPDMLVELGRDAARFDAMLEAGRARKRSFQNQVLARTKRLGRSFNKRKRELLVYLGILKAKLFGKDGGGGPPG